MNRRRSVSEIAAITLVLAALVGALSSLLFDDAASMARVARQAFSEDSRASTFRSTAPDPRISELAPPLARPAVAKSATSTD